MDKLKELQERSADLHRSVQVAWAAVEAADGDETSEDEMETLLSAYDEAKVELDQGQATLKTAEDRQAQMKARLSAARESQPLIVPRRSARIDVTQPVEDRPFDSFGQQLQAVYQAGLSGGLVDDRLVSLQAASGMSQGVGSDGGYAVQTDFLSDVYTQAYNTGDILSRVRRLPLSANSNSMKIPAVDQSSRVTGSRWGGVQGYWVAEGGSVTASKPKMRRIDLELHKVAALGYMTDELLADASALESIMSQAFAEELVWQIEEAIVNGDGAGKPYGIMSSAALVSVTRKSSGNDIETEDIVGMWARLHGGSRQNAVWLVNQDAEPDLYVITLGNQPMWLPAGGINEAPRARLMGRDVIENEHCATKGTTGDIILVDLSQYIVIDKAGPSLATSAHVKFSEDEMAFRLTTRVDGQPMWNKAVTPAKGSNTQSPYVVLA